VAKKTEEYDLYIKYIKEGYPPPKVKTRYDTKLPPGALPHIGKRIKAGQYVENLSAGSAGKLRGFVKTRGLTAIERRGQGEKRGTLYIVTKEWAAENPDRLT
jgi:hypothetical protein